MRPRRRLLVALLLEGTLATEVEGLRRALGGDLDRIAPHVTLAPPTNVPDGDVARVVSALDHIAARTPPFDVSIGPAASFAPRRPVVYLAVTSTTGELARLHGATTSEALVAPEQRVARPFVPHVTLASNVAPEIAAASLAVLGQYEQPASFTRLHLLAQDEAAPGRPWRSIGDPLLGGRSRVSRGGREIELAVSDTLDPFAAAWARAAWDAYSLTTYGPTWRRDESFTVVARERGAAPESVAGVALGEIRGEVCACERLVVDPLQRGQGVGSALVRHVGLLASERGCRLLRLLTLDGGGAERFYSGHGFRRTTVLPSWREGRDFVVMVRELGAGSR